MYLIIIVKLLVVVALLVIFLRRPSLLAGIGLITVTTAVLLDTFLGTFNREQMLMELGFFFYIIAGALLGGTAVWVWGLLQPLIAPQSIQASRILPSFSSVSQQNESGPITRSPSGRSNSGFDRQMVFDEIRTRLSPEDVRDLIFDLNINENDVVSLHQDMNQLIINLMDHAETNGDAGALALAVERILTPPPSENLPRLEKIDSSSPPTILRHYLLAHYDFDTLARMATRLNIDWQQLNQTNKKSFVRELLIHLSQRNNLDRLVMLMHEDAAQKTPPAT